MTARKSVLGRPFARGFDRRRNAGGKPYLKLHQRLCTSMAAELKEVAPDRLAKRLGLPPGSTWARCICRRAVMLAANEGDVSAMRFVAECTDVAQTTLSVHVNADVATLLEHAREEVLSKLTAIDVPPLLEEET
jgi:hypothetical protein